MEDRLKWNSNFEIEGSAPKEDESIPEKTEVKPVVEKTTRKYKVVFVAHETHEIILEDEAGNGWRLPLPDKYKKAKTGDIVYL